MIPIRFTLLLLGAPAVAMAQVTYTEARIVPAPTWSVDEVSCAERHNALADRRAMYDDAKLAVDQEGADLDRESAWLAEQLRNLDSTNVAAVEAYNRRSAEHNRRVAEHNGIVADLTARAASLNRATADAMGFCNSRMRDPEVIVWERLRIR